MLEEIKQILLGFVSFSAYKSPMSSTHTPDLYWVLWWVTHGAVNMYRLYLKFRPQTRYLKTGRLLSLKLHYLISNGNANIFLVVMTTTDLATDAGSVWCVAIMSPSIITGPLNKTQDERAPRITKGKKKKPWGQAVDIAGLLPSRARTLEPRHWADVLSCPLCLVPGKCHSCFSPGLFQNLILIVFFIKRS